MRLLAANAPNSAKHTCVVLVLGEPSSGISFVFQACVTLTFRCKSNGVAFSCLPGLVWRMKRVFLHTPIFPESSGWKGNTRKDWGEGRTSLSHYLFYCCWWALPHTSSFVDCFAQGVQHQSWTISILNPLKTWEGSLSSSLSPKIRHAQTEGVPVRGAPPPGHELSFRNANASPLPDLERAHVPGLMCLSRSGRTGLVLPTLMLHLLPGWYIGSRLKPCRADA